MATNFYGSICLTDIPKEIIETGKNSKKYLNIEVKERRTPSQWGHTHYIKATDRNKVIADTNRLYIGDLRPSKYNDAVPIPTASKQQPTESTDPLLPF